MIFIQIIDTTTRLAVAKFIGEDGLVPHHSKAKLFDTHEEAEAFMIDSEYKNYTIMEYEQQVTILPAPKEMIKQSILNLEKLENDEQLDLAIKLMDDYLLINDMDNKELEKLSDLVYEYEERTDILNR